MGRSSKAESLKTRARILASALDLFAKQGYERTTFVDIAARLQLTKGAIYWHFESKLALLLALLEEMLAKFRRQLEELMPKERLTFPAVAEMMVASAERIVADPRHAEFFMLMQTQVRWGDESLAAIRERLQSGVTGGPYHAILQAVENDIAAGRVAAEVNARSVASVAISMWTGLVRARIEHFLECDLGDTIRNAFNGIWSTIHREN